MMCVALCLLLFIVDDGTSTSTSNNNNSGTSYIRLFDIVQMPISNHNFLLLRRENIMTFLFRYQLPLRLLRLYVVRNIEHRVCTTYK